MNLAYGQPPLFYLWCVKKEYNMGKEQIMEDAVRDLTELALQVSGKSLEVSLYGLSE